MSATRSAATGHPLGTHRSLDGPGILPQAARRLDPSLPIRDNEILVAVERLNVEAVARWTDGRMASKVFNFASGPGTEAASILAGPSTKVETSPSLFSAQSVSGASSLTGLTGEGRQARLSPVDLVLRDHLPEDR